MSLRISGKRPPITEPAVKKPGDGQRLPAQPAPAAALDISPAARQIASEGQKSAAELRGPDNVIWGNSPK